VYLRAATEKAEVNLMAVVLLGRADRAQVRERRGSMAMEFVAALSWW
jgi:hypothetical protein